MPPEKATKIMNPCVRCKERNTPESDVTEDFTNLEMYYPILENRQNPESARRKYVRLFIIRSLQKILIYIYFNKLVH